jgi:lipoprotein-anchoring transpeptidase ErfK/SrfK
MNQVMLISIKDQRLQLREGDDVLLDFSIATASNGPGEKNGSECTPRGWHIVHEKIGDHTEVNSIFVGRQLTGELYSPDLKEQYPDRDWILTRILWLSGLEPGKNQSGTVDTLQRYIYIHGCPDDVPVGVPGSHGCIRMNNSDVIALYDRVSVGTRVLITEDSLPSDTPSLPH